MNRDQKVAAIERMHTSFETTPHVILTTFRGLTVNQANELRRKIDAMGGRYEVVKSRLAKRAAKGTSAEPLIERFSGPCALALHDTDPVGLAKALSEFAKVNPQIEMLSAVVDAKDVIDAEGVNHLATLPGLLELRAQLLALLQTPATSLVRLLNTPGGQIARAVDARRESLDAEPAD